MIQTSIRRWALIAAVAAGVVACLPSSGAVSAHGFTSDPYAYEIAFSDPTYRQFMPPPWRLDNFTRSGDAFHEKVKGTYLVTRELDDNNDGEISDEERGKESRYDLELVNDRNNGVIWAKGHPIASVNGDREIGVMVDNYIDSLSGNGLYSEGSIFSLKQVKERDFTTFVKDKRATTVDRHPAVSAVFELAEVEKLKADPAYRKVKVKVVFVRFGYRKSITYDTQARGWPVGHDHGHYAERRGILVLGYANTGDAFERSLPDFDDFVSRVRFPGSDPANAGPAEVLPASSASVAPPTPAPTPSTIPVTSSGL